MASRPRRPSSKQQALRQARPLLAAAEKGDREAAEVLVDLIEAAGGTQALAEDLLLALQGRAIRPTHSFQGSDSSYGRMIARGEALPLSLQKREGLPGVPATVTDALFNVRQRLFTHAKPCMPDREALRRLVEDNVAEPSRHARQLKTLWVALRNVCDGKQRHVGDAMVVANIVLEGHGVVRLTDRPEYDFDYVNMGDTYVTTLVYDHLATRFRVASWGDMVETAERRAEREQAAQGVTSRRTTITRRDTRGSRTRGRR